MSNAALRSGVSRIARRLRKLSKESQKIAKSMVGAGVAVLESAARNASPGSIKNEVGSYVRVKNGKVWGRAGLMQFPQQGQKGPGPHGIYLEAGTKYIQARHFISHAMKQAGARARVAMRRAGRKRIGGIINK